MSCRTYIFRCFKPLSPFFNRTSGLHVRVRLTPNARNDRVIQITADENGDGILRVAVTAVPENGKANKALVKFLPKQWRVPKSSLELVSGAKDRLKILHIEDDSETMIHELEKWAAQIASPSD